MKMTFIRRALFLLINLSILMPAAYQRSGNQYQKRGTSRLYRVSMWDEKSGEYKVGYIDNTGKMVIGFDQLPAGVNYVDEFYEGRALFDLKNEQSKNPGGYINLRVGYIDESGKVVIEPRFSYGHGFSEGLAYVRRAGFQGFINLQGREVIRVDDSEVKDFHEGMAAVGTSKGRSGKWGYINRAGRLVVERQYSFADDFSEGLAGVEVNHKFGFINREGEMVIPPRFGPRRVGDAFETVAASRFSEGLACVKDDSGAYGYINHKGEFVIPPRFARAQEFSEGLAWAANNEHFGWIDKTGRSVLTMDPSHGFQAELNFIYSNESENWNYSEGLVPFPVYSKDKNLNGYMNQKGEIVIQPREIYNPGPFRGGLARVYLYEKSVYREGKSGILPKPGEFQEEKIGYIDKTGRFVWRAP